MEQEFELTYIDNENIENENIENETTRLRSDSNSLPTNNSDLCLFSKSKIIKYENKVELKNKLISVFFHIFLMSMFEILFYFFFIVDIEKELFLDKLMTYNDQIKENYYANVSPEQQILITQMISYSFNKDALTQIRQNYDADMQKQKALFNALLDKAIILSSIVGTIFFITVIYGRKEIKVNWVLFENILLFFFLGLYEYIFFNMIILKYTPITDGEIQYLFVCNIASIFDVQC
jgi:hypothetical protein